MQAPKRVWQDRRMIKYSVRLQLSGRVFTCFLACLIPQVLPWILRLFPSDLAAVRFMVAQPFYFQTSLVTMAVSLLATTFVTDPMMVRLAAFFIRLNQDPENLPSPLSVCDCFGPGYLRLVGGMLLRSLDIMAFTLLPLCIGAFVPGTWFITEISGMDMLMLGDAALPFMLVSAGLGLYRNLCYTMVPYILSESPYLSPLAVLRKSRELTKGRMLELLLLQLSFFGWLLFVSVTLFIGAIYAYPYIEGTMAAYYLAYKEPMPWEMDRIDAD